MIYNNRALCLFCFLLLSPTLAERPLVGDGVINSQNYENKTVIDVKLLANNILKAGKANADVSENDQTMRTRRQSRHLLANTGVATDTGDWAGTFIQRSNSTVYRQKRSTACRHPENMLCLSRLEHRTFAAYVPSSTLVSVCVSTVPANQDMRMKCLEEYSYRNMRRKFCDSLRENCVEGVVVPVGCKAHTCVQTVDSYTIR